MESEVVHRLLKDVDCVVDQAQPTDPARRALAGRIASEVAADIEELIEKAGHGTDAHGANSRHNALASADGAFSVDDTIRTALPWLLPPADKTPSSQTERRIYSQHNAFVLVVAHLVKTRLANHDTYSDSCRLVMPYKEAGTKPAGADDGTMVDASIVCCDVNSTIEAQLHPSYTDILAIVEAKGKLTPKNTRDAYAQLFDYTRNIYYNQMSRRFAWGLTCCGSVVNACIFTNYKVLASPNIDVKTKEGRLEFVRLLVGWSLCSTWQLGFDETISWNADLKCFEVQVPRGDNTGKLVTYYSTDVILAAERLFGRHCRCFLATNKRPAAGITEDNPLVADCVIKDSWALFSDDTSEPKALDYKDAITGDQGISERIADVQLDDEAGAVWPSEDLLLEADSDAATARSEILLLKKVRRVLGSESSGFKGLYPRITDGGWVYQRSPTSLVPDSTRAMAVLCAEQQRLIPFCLHARYAMEPIGEPLETVRSVPELIVVLKDAMECYMALYTECKILHRDISDNNILVVREGSSIRGLLIDYDCAIDLEKPRQTMRPERTGTLPFMSVGNLEQLPIPRTPLDDWESLLYLVCWLGTFGINDKYNDAITKTSRTTDFLINYWRVGNEMMIAEVKRGHMDSEHVFAKHILSNLDKDQDPLELLRDLAMNLHGYLFFNPRLSGDDRINCHGAVEHDPKKKKQLELATIQEDSQESDSSYEPGELDDPFAGAFEPRVPHADAISKDLLKVLKRFAKQAKKVL
ncbi:hypothetical protein BX070DRAFT_230809 [Coemansia spiralis]|nr:hypothetical protein BX070DRAFT_230809 [Coemansia spiralis]